VECGNTRTYDLEPLELIRRMIQECPHLRWHVNPTPGHELHGQWRGLIFLQHANKRPDCQVVNNLIGQHSRDAAAGACGYELGIDLIHQ